MSSTSKSNQTIEVLISARKVANFAASQGIELNQRISRSCYDHLGAVLADSVLQSGLRYASVVRPRIERILIEFSKADTTAALLLIVNSGDTGRFLNWQHTTKICRFEELVRTIDKAGIENVTELRTKLSDDCFCDVLQQINGVGPKTVDYMGCLVGIESVAVDRHIRSYAKRAGVEITDYHFLKKVFCYAADFLAVSRREFDAWIWLRESGKTVMQLGLQQ